MIVSLMVLVFTAIIQDFDNGYMLFRENFCTPTGLSIIFGCCLLCLSWLAIASICLRSPFLLSTYFCILFITSVIEVATVIALFVMKSHIIDLVTDSLLLAQSRYTIDNTSVKMWNTLQHSLKCCGVETYSEWFHYLRNSSVPDSCCTLYSVGCGRDAVRADNFYLLGCVSAISNWTHKHIITISVFFSFAMLMQILSLFASQFYRRSLSD